MKIAMIVEYEGTNYHGFQRQQNVRTVQEEIEKSVNKFTGEEIKINGAGRTDAGVHATGQVVAFNTGSVYGVNTFVGAVNHYLPEDISVKKVWEVSYNFHPRKDAISKVYTYSILNSEVPSPLKRKFVTMVKHRLDVDVMNEGAKLFLGEHDFKVFTCSSELEGKCTIREIVRSHIDDSENMLRYTVEGNGFLRYQIRRMVGALVKVGIGKMGLDELRQVISGNKYTVTDRMPAKGLCLYKVNY